ncbi:hypothetical protein JCM10450v2_007505 [Rhodotorula kratochvilovae]
MEPGPTRRAAYGTFDARYLVAPPPNEEPYFDARALDLRCAAYPLLILAGLLVFALSCGVFVHHAHLSPSSAARLLSRSGGGDSADLAALKARVRVLEEKVWALAVEAEGRRRAAHGG